jgi:hypothetical protein
LSRRTAATTRRKSRAPRRRRRRARACDALRSYGTPCQLEDNINFGDPSFTLFNKLVVVVNFLLVACFAVLYHIENQRETWLSTCVLPLPAL